MRQFEVSEIIKDIFLLKGLNEKDKNDIISMFHEPRKFKKGDIIYSAEHFPNAIGFVINGKAAALTDNSDGVYMKTFLKGNVFGVAAIFGNDDKYISTIIAKTDMEILFIDENTLKKIFELYPKVTLNYISFLTEKVRFLNNKLNLLSSSNSEDTVYKYLCSIKDENNIVKIPVSMTLLSKMLGLGRATLYRSFDNLENEGKIKRENNIIKVIKNEKNS